MTEVASNNRLAAITRFILLFSFGVNLHAIKTSDPWRVTGHISRFSPLQGQCLVALVCQHSAPSLNAPAASFRQCTVAVRAGLLFSARPPAPASVPSPAGIRVLMYSVGGVGFTAASPGDAQRLQLLALPVLRAPLPTRLIPRAARLALCSCLRLVAGSCCALSYHHGILLAHARQLEIVVSLRLL